MSTNKAIRNLFLKMNTDSSQIKQDNQSFYDAVDLRLISDEALSNGALTNFKGTKARLTLGTQASGNGGYETKLKGYDYINDTIILLLYNVAYDYSMIATANILDDIPVDEYGMEYIPSLTYIYSDAYSDTKLNFNTVNYIATATRYESEDSQKLYFMVKGEPLRFINIVGTYSSHYDASNLDIIPNNTGGNITIDSINDGGNLQAGKIQYSYRLFKRYGAETTFSPTSDLINLTSSSPKGYVEFTGADLEDFVDKSVSLQIEGIDTTFDYINIYSIFYSQKGLPIINLVGELPINQSTIKFIDNGKILDTLTLEEFNSFGGRLFTANDIESKNNILFAGGIEEFNDDVDIDCRAYRYKDGVVDSYAKVIIEITDTPVDGEYFTITLPTGESIDFTAKTSSIDSLNGDFLIGESIGKGTAETINSMSNTAAATLTNIDSNYSTLYSVYINTPRDTNNSITIEYNAPTGSGFTADLIAPWTDITVVGYSTAPSKAIVYESSGGYFEIEPNGYFRSYGITPAVVGNNWELPETADCINKYNDEFLHTPDDYSIVHPYPYNRTADGAYYGGTGSVVSYKLVLDSTSYKLTENSYNTLVNASNETFILQSSSLKQGEVYRAGINFYDTKGRPYFTKWVGDIRVPYLEQFSFMNNPNFAKSIWGSNIKLVVSLDLTSIPDAILDTISGARLAMVERTQADKSIITQGVSWLSAYDTHNSVDDNLFMHKSVPLSVHSDTEAYSNARDVECLASVCADPRKDYIHPIYSPELFYNNGIDISGNNYRLKVVKIFSNFDRAIRTINNPRPIVYTRSDGIDYENSPSQLGLGAATSIIYPTGYRSEVDSPFDTTNNTVRDGACFSVINSTKLTRTEGNNVFTYTLTDDVLTNKEVNFVNRVLPYNGNTENDSDFITMYGPTCAVFVTNKPIFKRFGDVLSGDNSAIGYVLDVYRDNAGSRYGGNTYYDRLLNTYIPVGEFVKISGDGVYEVELASGDIYNTIFDSLTSMHDPKLVDGSDAIFKAGSSADDYVARQQIVSLLPLESSVNCALANFKPSKYVLSTQYATGVDQDSDKIGLQETILQGVELYGSNYPTAFRDANSYNTAYSSVPIYPTTVPKPLIFETNLDKGTTIIASEVKVDGETVDSWTKFLYANVIDVEAEFGDIHRLEKYNNQLLYFQENGIGKVAVNDRYIISNQDAGQLSLGTGGILERFDYIKYNEGIVDPNHLINTINSIYYIDHNRNVLDSIETGEASLSTTANINSLFRKLYSGANTHVALGYNPKYKEVMFTIDTKTLVFNENTNTFAPRHSTVPVMWLNNDYKLLSYIEDEDPSVTARYIYQHGTGDRGEVYSEAYLNDLMTSSVTTIVNPNTGTVCAFNVLKWNTEIYNDGDNVDTASDLVEETINSIACKNTYQSATKNLVVDTQALRTSGDFDFTVNTSRRARYWTTQLPIDSNGNRLVDNTLILTLNYNNNDNKLFKLQDLITEYRIL